MPSDNTENYTMSLCWLCQRAVKKEIMCSWANDFEPVPGWRAKMNDKYRGKPSYFVMFCPKFIPDERVLAAVIDSESVGEFHEYLKRHYGNTNRGTMNSFYNLIDRNKDKFIRIGIDVEKGRKISESLSEAIIYEKSKTPLLKKIESVNPVYIVKDAPVCRRILRKKSGKTFKVRYIPMPKKTRKCLAEDCKYGGFITGQRKKGDFSVENNISVNHCCNYCTITGQLRTVERINGEVIRKNLIDEDGKCPLYEKKKDEEEINEEA